MFSRERNVVWQKCYMKCGIWNQVKIWSSHLLDNLSICLRNLKPICSSTKQNNAAPSIYYPCQSRGGREGWGLANLVRPWGRAIAKLGSPSDLCCPLHKHPLFWNECPMFNQPDLTGQTYSQLNLRSKSLEYRIFQKCESKFMSTT